MPLGRLLEGFNFPMSTVEVHPEPGPCRIIVMALDMTIADQPQRSHIGAPPGAASRRDRLAAVAWRTLSLIASRTSSDAQTPSASAAARSSANSRSRTRTRNNRVRPRCSLLIAPSVLCGRKKDHARLRGLDFLEVGRDHLRRR
jgi:hypothetical protein